MILYISSKNCTMTSQPSLLRYLQMHPVGIQTLDLQRHCIGFLVHGRKRIYHGDRSHELLEGEVFYLPPGHHTLEDIPESKGAEQIVCYFSAAQLAGILTTLHTAYQFELPVVGDTPHDQSHIVFLAWSALRDYFASLGSYLGQPDPLLEQLKMTELIYLLLSQPDCPLVPRLRAITAHGRDDFEQIVRSHILSELSLEELAALCNRSLTSFKKDFRALFHEPPHRWLTGQRLLYARTALRSTSRPVSSIARDCRFSTPSHFIKQFKKAYGITPAHYRRGVFS